MEKHVDVQGKKEQALRTGRRQLMTIPKSLDGEGNQRQRTVYILKCEWTVTSRTKSDTSGGEL